MRHWSAYHCGRGHGVILNLAVWFALHTIFGEVNGNGVAGLRLWLPVLHTGPAASRCASRQRRRDRDVSLQGGNDADAGRFSAAGCGYFLLVGDSAATALSCSAARVVRRPSSSPPL